jgi:branched-chain amino acid transport system ATP-binding protein
MPTLPQFNSINPAYPVEVAVGQIYAQHRNMARVYKLLETHALDVTEALCPPDAALIAATLRYIDGFSYRLHHSAEDTYLLPAMRESGADDGVIEAAMRSHAEGADKIAALRSEFDESCRLAERIDPPFLLALHEYIAFELRHIDFEENVVLPCAVDALPADHWPAIANAFRSYEDPLFGANPEPELSPLYHLLSAVAALH